MNLPDLRKAALGLIFSLTSLFASAQVISGPSPVGLNSVHTYGYSSSVNITSAPTEGMSLSTDETTSGNGNNGNSSNKAGDVVINVVDDPPPGELTWEATKGTIQSSWITNGVNYVSVKWTSTGTGTIKIKYQGGTVATKSVTISSCSGITVPSVTNASRCGPGSVTLGASKTGYSIRWYDGLTIIATGNEITRYLESSKTYKVTAFNATTGCESPKADVTGTVYSFPTPDAGADLTGAPMCGASSIALEGNTQPGSTGVWTIVSGTGGAITTPSSPTSSFNGVNGNSYVLRWTMTRNGCVASDDVSLTFHKLPDAQASNTILFSGNMTTIAITGNMPGTTFNWTSNGAGVTGHSSGYGTTIAQTLKTSSEVATATYTITPSNATCTGIPVTATATVHGVPTITGTSYRIALKKPVTMQVPAGFTTYTWKKGLQQIAAGVTSYTTPSTGSYQVEVTKTGVPGVGKSAPYVIKDQLEDLDENYIITTTPLVEGLTTPSSVFWANVDTVSQKIEYFDGLGRPAQTVITQGSPTKHDLVSLYEFDKYGREVRKYLPYAADDHGGGYRPDVVAEQQAFYQTGNLVPLDTRPFSETVFDNSPLNRAVKSYGAGQDWKNGTVDRPVRTDLEANKVENESIIAWAIDLAGQPVRSTVSNTSVDVGYYKSGQLLVTVTTDEENHVVREYKNKEGKVILKKVQAVNTPLLNNPTHWAQTYYIYDDADLLRYVFQPELSAALAASATDNPSQTQLDNYAFQYRYDNLNRMIAKRVPGSGWIYMVLDPADRVVLTQDGNQGQTGEWTFTKYDALGRTVSTGKYVNAKTRADMQTEVDAFYALNSGNPMFETYIGSAAGNVMGYNDKSFPRLVAVNDYYTFTYYDKYDVLIAPSEYGYNSGALFRLPSARNERVRGQVTATLVKNLGTGTWMRTVNHYDHKYRTIQAVSDHQKGKVRVSMDYDFAGKLLSTNRVYTINGVTKTVLEKLTYDHAGKLITVKHSVDGAPDLILARNKYNELGQLAEKDLHSEDNGTTFKQNVDYAYNIRGWMTKINNADISAVAAGDKTHDLFGMQLSYQDAVAGFTATPSFNGNISAIQWSKGVATSERQSYSYTYDAMNRLLDASHYDYAGAAWATNGNQFQEALDYDLNGNIKHLLRRGAMGNIIDSLKYGYNGNQLLYVNDSGDAAKGFMNANTGADDYSYDLNGNMDKDKNKGLSAKGDIAYNFLNLPKQVVKGADKLLYHYDATGKKLTQQLYTGANLTKNTEYVGDLFYENDTLKFINTPEGRYMPATGEYQYHLKDHLGNVHLTFTAKPETESATATLEPANLTAEQSKFLRYENAKLVYSNIFDKTNGVADGYSQRLSGGTNEVYGLARSLSVMPGDTVRMEVFAKYVDPTTSNWNAAFSALMSQIATGNSSVVLEGGSYSTSTSSFVNGSYLTHPTDDNAPKAYLNWLIFNRDFGFVNGGYVRMTNAAKENGQNVAHELLQSEVVITEPGYVYIYLSNESAASGGQQLEVYFDEFDVEQVKSPIVQTQDYYPFGLTFNSHRRENLTQNRYLYNQVAGEKKFLTERVFDLSLNVDLTKYRAYDYSTGRWWQVDPRADNDDLVAYTPYNYSFNNPVRYSDPEGDCPFCAIPIAIEGAAIVEGLVAAGVGTAIAATVAEFGTEIWKAMGNASPYSTPAVNSAQSGGGVKSLPSNRPKVTMPNGSKITAPGKGKGSVPPEKRDSKRVATQKDKKEMLDERGNKCEGCDKPATTKDVQAHHVDRHADGGATTKENLMNLCETCHKQVHQQAVPLPNNNTPWIPATTIPTQTPPTSTTGSTAITPIN